MSRHNHYPLRDDCAECDDLRDEYRKPEYHENERPRRLRHIDICHDPTCGCGPEPDESEAS